MFDSLRACRAGGLFFPFLSCNCSAGGLLFPYYLGVIERLRHHGVIDTQTPCAGSSAGSMAAAAVVSGVDTRLIADYLSQYLAELRYIE